MRAARTLTGMNRDAGAKKRWDWSLNNWGNRLIYSVLAGIVVDLGTGIRALGWVVAVVLFVLTSAVVLTLRR